MICFHLYDVTFGWVKLTSGLGMFCCCFFIARQERLTVRREMPAMSTDYSRM